MSKHSTLQSTLVATAEERSGRWAGRDADKDALREEIWRRLEQSGLNVGPVWSRISNWVGADAAAWRLAQLDAWKRAKVVKCNPDPPQIPVRLRALYEGKLLYMPVPEFITNDPPWLLLDPRKLAEQGVQFELAATSAGAMQVGEKCRFQDLLPIDFVVCGCIAVTRTGGRVGKGGGFADLELGLLRELGKVTAETPIVTTVHSSMVVEPDRVPILAHDSLLNWIATESELIQTTLAGPQPSGVSWERVQPAQFEEIWFLRQLKEEILSGRGH